MAKTIGNPLSWGAAAVAAVGSGIGKAGSGIAGEVSEKPVVREITVEDLRAALRAGLDDFLALRSDVIFICILYPIIGAALVAVALDAQLAPYIFPLASGFALIGPVAATGLYELSKRRERGDDVTWMHAFAPFRAVYFGPILTLGLYLLGLFLIWMLAAGIILHLTMGPAPADTAGLFFTDVFTTGRGLALIVIGTAVGGLFAAAVLAISVVSFPLLIDRRVGVPTAIATSLEVTRRNPRTVAVWGALVATGLVLGSLPVFLGLILVVPILGHATWHLYRKAVVPG